MAHSSELLHHLKPLIYFHRIFGCFDTKEHSKFLKIWRLINICFCTVPTFYILIFDWYLFFKDVKNISFLKTILFISSLYQSILFLILIFQLFIFTQKFKRIFDYIEDFLIDLQVRYCLQIEFKSLTKHSWIVISTVVIPIISLCFSHKIFDNTPDYELNKGTILFSYFYLQTIIGVACSKTLMFPLIFNEVIKVLQRTKIHTDFSYNFSKLYETIQCLKDRITSGISLLTLVMVYSLFFRIILVFLCCFNLFRLSFEGFNGGLRDNIIASKSFICLIIFKIYYEIKTIV